MGSTARQLHHDDNDRPSPQALARQLTQMDRAETTPNRSAEVTMLHGTATATRTRKPRARVKTSDQAPANQVHGFATRASTTTATPITGQAPSLLRQDEASVTIAPTAPATVRAAEAPTCSAVSGTPTPARAVAQPVKAPRGVVATVARVPGLVVEAGLWAKHVMLGSGLAFMERLPEVLNPVAFVFANLITILIGLAYCAIPAGMGLFLLGHFPALHDAFLVNGPMKVVYMGLLYITCGFVALVGAFALRALALGLVRTLNGFAQKGQTAFSD